MFQKITLIILLTTLSLRPAFFVGKVVYYETHLSEIIEKYCINKDKPALQCNGQCHLSKEVSGINTTDDSKAVVNISSAFFPVYFQSIELSATLVPIVKETKNSYNNNYFTYSYLLSNKIDKPPMV